MTSERERHRFSQRQHWHRIAAVLALVTLITSPITVQGNHDHHRDDVAINPDQVAKNGAAAVLSAATSGQAHEAAISLLRDDYKYHGVIYGDGNGRQLFSSDTSTGNEQHQHGPTNAKNRMNANIYPPKDRIPDINSPQVKLWLKEVDWSKVPDIPVAPTRPNAPHFPNCPPNAQVNHTSCWWSCDGCVAPDDIVTCPQGTDWGLTYDDGPSAQSREMMRFLQERNITATFFIVGSRVLEYPDILREQVAQGHHIAMHTWSHGGLTTLTNEQIVAEIKWTEKIIRDVTGLTTKYVRPPYGDVDNRVREILRQLGYKTVIWTKGWDTNDWRMLQHQVAESEVLQSFQKALNQSNLIKSQSGHNAGPITLEHDLTAETIALSKRLIPMGMQQGLRPMNLAQCLADDTPYQRGSKLGPNGAVGKPHSGDILDNANGLPGMTAEDFMPPDTTASHTKATKSSATQAHYSFAAPLVMMIAMVFSSMLIM
ncbi:chitin deacetylase [Actinomortierella wolfii]|nr:chitin deacetylase [Actinomortierella wolfii]